MDLVGWCDVQTSGFQLNIRKNASGKLQLLLDSCLDVSQSGFFAPEANLDVECGSARLPSAQGGWVIDEHLCGLCFLAALRLRASESEHETPRETAMKFVFMFHWFTFAGLPAGQCFFAKHLSKVW